MSLIDLHHKADVVTTSNRILLLSLSLCFGVTCFYCPQLDLVSSAWSQERDEPPQESEEVSETKAIAETSRSRLLDQNRGGIDGLWREWYATLEELTDHEVKQGQLPEFSWFSPFRETKESNLKKIRELSERLLIAFRNPQVDQLRTSYFELREKIDTDLAAARQAAEDSYQAPEEGEVYFWETHRGDYLDLKQKKEKAVKAYRLEQQKLITSCHDALLKMGVELTPQQVEQLFKMSEGDVMLTLFATFAQLNLLGDYVTEKMSQAQGDEDYAYMAKRYYAVYVAIISLSWEIHTYTREKLLKDHLVRLDKLRARLTDVIKSTKRLTATERQHIKDLERTLSRGSSVQQERIAEEILEARSYLEQLQANLKVQTRAQEGASAYRTHLLKQADEIRTAAAKIHRRRRIAFNTYQTVLIGTDQFDLMREGLRDLSNLQRIQVPAMVPLAGERITDHLDMITRHFSGQDPLAGQLKPQDQLKR